MGLIDFFKSKETIQKPQNGETDNDQKRINANNSSSKNERELPNDEIGLYIKKYSSDFQELYKIGIDLAIYISRELEKTDYPYFRIDRITMDEYDILLRTCMYILRIKIFDDSKYNKSQIDLLEEIFRSVTHATHSFYITKHYKSDEVFNKYIFEVEELYDDLMNEFDLMFMKTDQTLEKYITMPLFYCGHTVAFNRLDIHPIACREIIDSINDDSYEGQLIGDFFSSAKIGVVKFFKENTKRIDVLVKNIVRKMD